MRSGLRQGPYGYNVYDRWTRPNMTRGVQWDLEFRQGAEARSAVIRVKGGCDLEPGAWGRRDINEEDS